MTFCRSPFDLSALELATGLAFGQRSEATPVFTGEIPRDPPAALEQAVLPALLRPPCVVSFSGGRDSSVVLAAAAAVARREGLQLPIPATNVFPGVATADETLWQERVVEHLGLSDWVRLELHDELDCAGPLARSIFARHGLLFPFNAHFHWPLLEVARGGSLLTGIGGDELLGTSDWARASAVLAGALRPTRAELRRLLVVLAPEALRRRAFRRRYRFEWNWLTPEANREASKAIADGLASEPFRWARRWTWWCGRRDVELGFRSLRLLAADCDAVVHHPLADPAFGLAAGALASSRRIFDRTAMMRVLFDPLLPASVLERQTKASFNAVFWGPESRGLALGSAAEALAELEVVDLPALERVWATETRPPDAHTYLLLEALAVRSRTTSPSGE